MEYKLRVLSMHELGQRANQEDYMYPVPGTATDDDRCFVLCDGMGGHDSGEVASQAVCETMGGYVKNNCPAGVFTPDDLRAALDAAYDALDARDTHAAKKMGTTMTFANFHEGGCLVAHMGDSRVYHMRPSVGILFETRDHSLLNDLIKVGELTEETAKDFKQKNVITRCMQPNNERRSRADIKEITDIRPGDYIFMCSDGVNEVMESRHLANVILDSSFTDEEKMRIITDNTTEARDNHTAYLIHVLDVTGVPPIAPTVPLEHRDQPVAPTQQPSTTKKSKLFGWVSGVVALLLVAAAGAYFYLYAPEKGEEQVVTDKVGEKVELMQGKQENNEFVNKLQNSVPGNNNNEKGNGGEKLIGDKVSVSKKVENERKPVDADPSNKKTGEKVEKADENVESTQDPGSLTENKKPVEEGEKVKKADENVESTQDSGSLTENKETVEEGEKTNKESEQETGNVENKGDSVSIAEDKDVEKTDGVSEMLEEK